MVQSCSALRCTSRRKGGKLKFHKIPKDINLRTAWLHALQRVSFDSKHAVVCEKHFPESDYEINVFGNRVLKKGSIPSLFGSRRRSVDSDEEIENVSENEIGSELGPQNENNPQQCICYDVEQIMIKVENEPDTNTTVDDLIPPRSPVTESETESQSSNSVGNQHLLYEIHKQDPTAFGELEELSTNSQENTSVSESIEEIIIKVEEESDVEITTEDGFIPPQSPFYKSEPERQLSDIVKNHPPFFKKLRRISSFGDFQESDLNNEYLRRRFFELSRQTVATHREQNEYYQQRINYQSDQIKKLKALLKNLKKEKMSSTEI